MQVLLHIGQRVFDLAEFVVVADLDAFVQLALGDALCGFGIAAQAAQQAAQLQAEQQRSQGNGSTHGDRKRKSLRRLAAQGACALEQCGGDAILLRLEQIDFLGDGGKPLCGLDAEVTELHALERNLPQPRGVAARAAVERGVQAHHPRGRGEGAEVGEVGVLRGEDGDDAPVQLDVGCGIGGEQAIDRGALAPGLLLGEHEHQVGVHAACQLELCGLRDGDLEHPCQTLDAGAVVVEGVGAGQLEGADLSAGGVQSGKLGSGFFDGLVAALQARTTAACQPAVERGACGVGVRVLSAEFGLEARAARSDEAGGQAALLLQFVHHAIDVHRELAVLHAALHGATQLPLSAELAACIEQHGGDDGGKEDKQAQTDRAPAVGLSVHRACSRAAQASIALRRRWCRRSCSRAG